MRRQILLGCFFLLLGPWGAQAEVLDYSEDFSSTLMKDLAATTAVWDTLSGSVRLAPMGLSPLGSVNTAGNSYATTLALGYIFLADGTGGLHSYASSDAAVIVEADYFATTDQVRGITTQGNWAYLAVGSSGLQSFDISDPTDMVAGGSAEPTGSGFASGIATLGSYAYLANSGEGIAVVEINSPASPQYSSSVATNDWARGVTIHGGNLLVADGTAGLTVMSLANPASPTIIGALSTGGNCFNVTARGTNAFMADGANGLVVVDFSDPSDPIEIGHLDAVADPIFTGTCRHVAAEGDTLFVASGSGGLYLVDVTDPTSPTVVGHRDTDGESTHVTLVESDAWLSDGQAGLATFAADPGILNTTNNIAQSLDLSGTGEPISRAKISASFTESITFELSCNGGTNWEEVIPDDDWHEFLTEGTEISWRMTLQQETEEQNPRCDEITITYERLQSYAEILSVSDVPADTGGQIRVLFSASRFDAPAQDEVITEYSIYRRYHGSDVVARNEDKRYPPGSWDFMGTIPADQEAEYGVTIATLADSSAAGLNYTAVFVRARTATLGLFFDSPVDSAYSVNNVQPARPTGFLVDRSPADGNQLTWNTSPEPDFAHFRIYRAPTAETLPQPSTLLHVTGGSSFFDTTEETWFYHLTVVDTDGNESAPVSESAASPVPHAVTSYLNNSPNPFNPTTRIEFRVPSGGRDIRLEIYDFRGHLVRLLHSGFLDQGIHHRSWDGTDGAGRGVASGIYNCQLSGSGRPINAKMTLVR